MTNKDTEAILKEIIYNRQMQKKRLYEQAKRANKQKQSNKER